MFENKDTNKVDAVKTPATEVKTEGVELTEEQKKAKKNEASKKMIAKKKAAIKVLADLANRMGTPDEKKAAAYLSGEGRVAGVRTPAQDFIAILFKSTVGTTIGEGDVFKATKMGRLEMRALIKKEVNHGNWIAFDAVKEVYTFVAKGDKAPAGWNGPMPKAPKL